MSESLEDCLDEETLIASTHGQLGARSMARVEAHLDRCDACRELVAEMVRTSSHVPAAPTDQLEVGASCDRYLILNRIGVGGMGVVYSAWDDRLDRKLALKVVRPGGDPSAQQRLLGEARVMASIRHPNVLTVYEVGEVVAGVYIAMEYLRGGTLRDWLQAHPEEGWRAVLARFTEAGRGLDAAHGVGVVHRDFKPDNVLLEGSRVCVADFGLARLSDPAEREETQPGRTAPAGTPAYMAPETTIGPAVDQYALCVATWEALFGELPRGGRSRLPARSGVPAGVRRVLERGLESDPARRFASVTELISALERAANPRRWSVLGLAVVGVIATGLGWTQVPESCGDARRSWNERWNQQRRDRLRAGFSATNVPYAAATFDQLDQRIDRYEVEEVELLMGLRSPQLAEALEAQRELYGERSPLVASALGALAVAKSNAGELDAALALWDESIRISAAARGEDDVQVVVAEAERATLLLRIDPQRALAPLRGALDAFGGMQSRQPITMIVRDAIARAHARLGDGEEAVRRWNAILEDMGALEASELGLEVHLQLGLELAEQGAASEARRHLERAARIGSANPDLSRPWEADLAVATAVASMQEGVPTPDPLERALAEYERRHVGGSERALATFVLARTLFAEGRYGRARLVLEAARALADVLDRVLARRIASWRSEHVTADHQDS